MSAKDIDGGFILQWGLVAILIAAFVIIWRL